jgi:septal ring factor EnvC (AmiA/AmiB activator)
MPHDRYARRAEKTGGRDEQAVAGLADRPDLLAVVQTQLEDVYRELESQRKRTSHLQTQLDELAIHVRRLTDRLGTVIDQLQAVVHRVSTRSRTSIAADRSTASK